MATGTIKNRTYVVEKFTTNTASISANGTAWLTPLSVSKSGYTPIGIVGYYCIGADGVVAVPYANRIENGVASIAIKNTTSSSGTAYVQIYVLYSPT